MNIRKNDLVEIIVGKDKGKTGKVLRIIPDKNRLVVEKLNMVKRHMKPSQKHPQGGVLEKEAPLSYSNVLLLCPKCNQGKRIGKKLLKNEKKVRICKKCGEVLDK